MFKIRLVLPFIDFIERQIKTKSGRNAIMGLVVTWSAYTAGTLVPADAIPDGWNAEHWALVMAIYATLRFMNDMFQRDGRAREEQKERRRMSADTRRWLDRRGKNSETRPGVE